MLAKRLREAVERKKAEQLPLIDSVEGINEHITEHTEGGTCKPAAIEMCVLSLSKFEHGWRCMLTDKDTQADFAKVQEDFDSLSYRETAEFVFQLTIWRGKKHPGRVPKYKPGSLLFAKRVVDLKIYHTICQGTTDMDDMMKEEDDQEAVGKKAKTHK